MKIRKILPLITSLFLFSFSFSSYYEPNADIAQYLQDVTDKMVQIKAKVKIGQEETIPPSMFSTLASDFSVLKNKLPRQNPKFKVIYQACEDVSRTLSTEVTKTKIDTFYSQCFGPWTNISRELFTKYAVKAKIKASPIKGNAPLTVTFDGRGSVDPSSDTIPSKGYYWYYKDSNGVKKLIGQGPLIKYTFNSPNTYVVHLTVRSSNKSSLGILDGEATTNIEVAPPIANISLYINGQRAKTNSYVKISDDEGKRGVLFDASGTTPKGETKIVESKWLIQRRGKTVYKDTIPDYPGAIRVKLMENGIYYVTLTIKDNTGKKVSKRFKLIVSNPVALINIKPEKGNTSTKFLIDGSASYSVKGKITKYKWSIVGPNGNIIDTFMGKKSFKKKFLVPGYYSIKLEVEDVNGNKNNEEYKLFVDSTPPVANFVYDKFDNWEKPSTFVFDASYSYDVDIDNGDKLTYIWTFSNKQDVKTQEINGGKKLIAQFNKKGLYKVKLIVKDKYGKISEKVVNIKVKSALRPEVDINPNYTVLGNPISIKVKTNKVVAYYEYYFGDKKYVKTQQNIIEHNYKKAGIYTLKVVAYSVDGDSNSITKKVFIGQKGYPIAIWKVLKNNKELIASENCVIKKDGKRKIVSAYSIDRQQNFIIDASKSVNGQGTNSFLKVYFQKDDEKQYINKNRVTIKFYDKGCRKITLFVRDLNTNKIDKKDIYFKVRNALPVLSDVKMYFPQYAGQQGGTFQPRIGNSNIPKDIFTTGFDPLLVKLSVIGAHDKDSSMLSYFRWYYYKKGNKQDPVKVKITPYNIPNVVFSVPRVPGEYIFGVDVCDVDGGCTNSEDYLHLKPIVNIPKSASNPDYPQINSVRVDTDSVKSASEIKVGEKVTITVNSEVPSKKPDFKSTRVIKYDFDNDGKWDLTTKKSKVSYVFKKPYTKHRVRALVIYRGNASNNGYSNYFSVIKGLKVLVDLNQSGKDLLFYDMSLGDIKSKILCFNFPKCIKDKDYLVKKDNYGYIHYEKDGKKVLIFKIKDAFGNHDRKKKIIEVVDDGKESKLLTLPKQKRKGSDYVVNIAGSYTDTFILYYKSSNKDCYIDKNIIVDSDKDGNTKNDKDLLCNRAYKLTYSKKPKVILLIHDGDKTKKIDVEFLNVQLSIPKKYQTIYDDILNILEKYSSSNDEDIQALNHYLQELLDNIDDRVERDSIVVNIKDWLDSNPGVLDEKYEDKLQDIVNQLSDKAVLATNNNTALQGLKDTLSVYIGDIEGGKEILSLADELDKTTNKQKRKEILAKIYKLVGKLKDQGKIGLHKFQDIKNDMCKLMIEYKIQSKICGANDTKNDTKQVEVKSTSVFSKILKIVGWFALVILIIFIIIIIVFVIKAKQRREEQEKNE